MNRTPEEQQALDAIAAEQAAGGDPFGDDEELVRDMPEGEAPVEQAADDLDADEKPAEPAQAETAESVEQPAEPVSQQPDRFDASLPTDYKEQRAQLMAEKAKAMKQLMDGEIDAEQYAAEELRVADQLENLMAQRIRAETLQEANSQNDARYVQRELNKLAARVKNEIDYKADPSAPKEFDRALGLLMADPDNTARDYADVIQDAHRMVMAMRGLKAPAAAPTAPASRRPEGNAPVTLRNLPSASLPNTGGGVIEQMSRLRGPEYEAAFSKLTPQQRATLLDEA